MVRSGAHNLTLEVTGNLHLSVTLINKAKIMASLRAEPVLLSLDSEPQMAAALLGFKLAHF